jgi:hypothetical protein
MIGVLPIGRPRQQDDPMVAFFWSTKPDQAEQLKQRGLEAWKEEFMHCGRNVNPIWPRSMVSSK